MNTIHDRWHRYLTEVMPSDAPPIQIKETRRAFYAGIATMLDAMLDMPTMDDDRAAEWMKTTHDECANFFDLIQMGKA